MADKKPSGFRFRLPWLLSTPAREPPRTAPQTSVSSTSAQRPPFRPPGRAPVLAAPPMVATPAPASPRRSPPQSVPKSSIAETIEPVATQATKETQTTTETVQTTETEPVKETQTTTETIPTAETPPRQPQFQQSTSPPQSPPRFRVSSLPDPVSPTHIRTPPQSVPKSPIAETIEPVATQATKETQTTTETVQTTETEPLKETQTTTETIPTAETPPQTPPRQPQFQQSTSPPQSPPQFRFSSLPDPVSPTHIRTPPQTNSQPRSPTRMATPTNPSSPSPEASPPRAASQPSSPVHGQPSQTHTPPRSPSKTSSSPAIPEIKRSTDITKVKEAQTKSQRPKPITASTQVPLQREIKDDISKFIHKIATISTSKQSMNEQQQSVITIAGDNKGALMHLNSDAIKREIKQDSKFSENEEMKAIVNSNIQGINNSMMFNSSIIERNPGVHLVITRNLLTNMNDSEMKNAKSMEMQRAEFNVSPPQKLVYDPMIERSMQGDFEPDDFETPPNSHEIEVL